MLENLGFLVEVPISGREARTRQLPETVGKLVLYAVEKTKEDRASNLARLAYWLWQWVESKESMYASPLVPFLSEKKMADFLASTRLQADTVRIDVGTYLIPCSSQNVIASILDQCTSEAIVLMTDTDGRSARETLLAVERYARDHRGYETPFMSRLETHGGFFFFAETHQSLEMLGTEDFIRRRCLRPLLAEVVRAKTSTE
jgi:hypothetical protein